MPQIDFSLLVETLSGLMVFIFAAYQAFSKIFGDVGVFKKKKEEKEKEERQKRKEEYSEYLSKSSKEIITPVINELKNANEEQNKKLDRLARSSNDVLRREITKIYYKYLPYKKLPRYLKEELFVLYQDYKEQGGNSFITEIYEEMKTWAVVQTEEEVYEDQI